MKHYFLNENQERVNFSAWVEKGQRAEVRLCKTPREAAASLFELEMKYLRLQELSAAIRALDLPCADVDVDAYINIDKDGVAFFKGSLDEVLLEARRRISVASRLVDMWTATYYDFEGDPENFEDLIRRKAE